MKKILTALLALVVVLLVGAFFSLNFLVKKGVNTEGPEILKVPVHLASADISPLSGSGSLSHLLIGNPKGYFTPYAILLGGIKVRSERDSLFSNPIAINEISITSPEINIEGTPFGNNLLSLLSNLKETSRNEKSSGGNTDTPSAQKSEYSKSAKRLIVKQINITGAKLHVHVSAANERFDQTLDLPDIHLSNIGSDGAGVSPSELSRQIITPLLDVAVREGGKALAKQGIKQLEKQGADQINKVLRGFLK